MSSSPRGIDRLLELQEIDLASDRSRARREILESGEDVQAARERLGEAEAREAARALALDDVAREQRRLEGDVDSFGQRIAAEEKRLYDGSVANAKELESIQAEVTGVKGRRSRVEDQLLEVMERREQMEAELESGKGEVEEARGSLEAAQGSSAEELARIDEELRALVGRREAVLPSMDPDLLELYEDLRRQKKGVGAAALVDGVCQGCHQKLSAVELDRLKRADGIRRCEYCRRILVFD